MTAAISPQLVKQLRDRTNAGMMDCKRALEEARGDLDEAETLLRKKGAAIAEKKSGRSAADGLVGAHVVPGGRIGSLVEVNCETDFVAKNEIVAGAVQQLAQSVAVQEDLVADGVRILDDEALCLSYAGGTFRDFVTSLVAKVGENIVFRRVCRLVAGDRGLVTAYVHHGSKIGVLVELCCAGEAPAGEIVRQARTDIALQVAASSPGWLTRGEIPQAVLDKEKDIYRGQMAGKPAQVLEKIIQGKLEKFYADVCLLEQAFVKDPDISIAEYLARAGKEAGAALTVRRFVRFQVGEAVDAPGS